MQLNLTPFNISLLSNERGRLGTLLPVQSMDIYGGDGDFNPQGLYSSEIFGRVGDKTRMQRHSFIDMKTTVLHPKIFIELGRLKNLYKGILAGTAYATFDIKEKDFVKSDILSGETGYGFFMRHFPEMKFKRNESPDRDLRIDLVEKYRGSCMYRYLVVLPAGLREPEIDEDGRLVEDELNALYRKALRISNTISGAARDENNPALDAQRWSLQSAFNEVYDYFDLFLSGKHGFLLSRYATRSIQYGTRNVLTAMDPAPEVALALESISVNHTACGLHQYMMGIIDLTLHHVKNGIASHVVGQLPNSVELINRKTLTKELVEPSPATIEKWGTIEGLEKLANGFKEFSIRHKPVVIDDHYLALMYNDGKEYKVYYDINDVDPDKRAHVSPITWAEFWYLTVEATVDRVVGFVTRYPITGMGSVYPCIPYLMSTHKGVRLSEVGNPSKVLPRFPIKGAPFFESMAVHPGRAERLGSDHDGDKCSLNFSWSKEAVSEVLQFMDSPKGYVSPDGSLVAGIRDEHIANDVLNNLTFHCEKMLRGA